MASLWRIVTCSSRRSLLKSLAVLAGSGMALLLLFVSLQVDRGLIRVQQRELDTSKPSPAAGVESAPQSPVKLKPTDGEGATLHLTVRDRCRNLSLASVGGAMGGRTRPLQFPMSPVISTKHQPNLFYCPLAKAGSTYFTRYMMAVDQPGPMVSPFSIAIQDAGRTGLESFASLETLAQREDFLHNSFRFLFTRDPWSRIFSTYIDKLYSPNPYYWGEWGQAAVLTNRLPVSDHVCGTGVSFRHFVKLVLRSLHIGDLHFIPMLRMCRVCDVAWDMVGQVERSREGEELLSNRINVSAAYQQSAEHASASARDVIADSTTDAFGDWRRDIERCIGLYDAGRIIWRRLQIRGIIYSDAPFPFSRQDMAAMTASQFQQTCNQAASEATDKARLKQQKTDAFREAYASVDIEDLNKLREIYANDFYLFGYDPKPSSIFGSDERRTDERILNWRLDWS